MFKKGPEMKTKKLLFYLLAVLMGGCVPVLSLHPLYTKENVVFKQELLGTWTDPNAPKVTWEFKRADESETAYKLIFSDEDGRKGSFETHLVKLEDRLFLDLYPDEFPCDLEDPNKVDWPYNAFFLVPVHTFIKVDSIEPALKMRLTLDNKMEQLLKENPKAVKHTVLEDKPVLTASTKELQAFVLKYADDERLFGDPIVLKRIKAKDPQKPADKQSGHSAGK
ncbi:MAG: hypothetical protein KAY65_02235 [Planctomycetes bacterium]|nr:hypothetical protein [Planctomycetota bacterium]